MSGYLYVDCPACGFSEYSTGPDKPRNVCRYCGTGVYHSQEEQFESAGEPDDEAVVCTICGSYCHRDCAEGDYHKCVNLEQDFVCPDCLRNSFVVCVACGLLHEKDCMVVMDGNGRQLFGGICEECFYDDEHEIEGALKYAGFDQMLDTEKARYYFKHAAGNPDMTICCTHLIRAEDDEQAFAILSSILKR